MLISVAYFHLCNAAEYESATSHAASEDEKRVGGGGLDTIPRIVPGLTDFHAYHIQIVLSILLLHSYACLYIQAIA